MNKPTLSIIILNFNTRNLLRDCLLSLNKVKKEIDFDVLVSDNGSTDGSWEMIEKNFPWVKKVIRSKTNLGFAAGNNKARDYAKGKYVLFLNSDTIVNTNTLKLCVAYLEKNLEVGALTCKILLPNGDLDKDARRAFITPWIGLTHLYLKIDRLFPNSKIFAKYWYGYVSPNQIHEVDAIEGAFFLIRKKILDDVGWFEEDYFLDGEDIDLCWKVKEKGWKIVYYPKVSILHIKGATKGKNNNKFRQVPFDEKVKYRMAGVNSMEIFVKKRLLKKYPGAVMYLVLLGIKILKAVRFTKLVLFG